MQRQVGANCVPAPTCTERLSVGLVSMHGPACTCVCFAWPGTTWRAGLPDLADVSPSYPTRLFGFSQRVPIPSYLVALAAGELQARDLGPRTR